MNITMQCPTPKNVRSGVNKHENPPIISNTPNKIDKINYLLK